MRRLISWCTCHDPRVEHEEDGRCSSCVFECNLYQPRGLYDCILDAINWIASCFVVLEKPLRPEGR